MVSLNELCQQADPRNLSLSRACALPRSAADMTPLPEPHSDISFDSSWEALLAGTPLMAHWSETPLLAETPAPE